MDQDLIVNVSFNVTDSAGKPKARISVEYYDHNWDDVLKLEKFVLPAVMERLFAAGDAFNAAAPSTGAATAV